MTDLYNSAPGMLLSVKPHTPFHAATYYYTSTRPELSRDYVRATKKHRLKKLLRRIARSFKGRSHAHTTSALNFPTGTHHAETPLRGTILGRTLLRRSLPCRIKILLRRTLRALFADPEPPFPESLYADLEPPFPETFFPKPPSPKLSSSKPPPPKLFFLDQSSSSKCITFLPSECTASPSVYGTTRPPPGRTEPPQPKPSSIGYSPFEKLPIELFPAIVAFLPLVAAASLTLTCRSIRVLLGRKYLDELQDNWRERLEFLHLLERDLPRHIVCKCCIKLHSRAQKQLYGGTPCKREDYKKFLSVYIHPEFDSVAFRLAMKLYHNGLDYSEQLSRLSGSGTLDRTDYTYNWEPTLRIVYGHFLARHKTTSQFSRGAENMPVITIDSCICPDWYTVSCHVRSLTRSHFPAGYIKPAHSSTLTKKLYCRASHWDDAHLNSNCLICAGLYQCEFCPTEFEVDTEVFVEHGVELTLTRWLNLGEGWNPEDKVYASHVFGHKGSPVHFKPGSIKAAFDAGPSVAQKWS